MLPSELSVLAETLDGAPLSLLLRLRRNTRDQVDVRHADGAQAYDGHRVWQLSTGPRGADVFERVSGRTTHLEASLPVRMRALAPQTLWLDTPTGTEACSLLSGRCAAGAPPELILSHPGPGAGFRVALEHGELSLYLPQDNASGGITLASRVRRILGVYWVRNQTREAEREANRVFRGRARVHAPARRVTADGSLGDWPDAAPLVVEEPWQLQSGADGWDGARDASFSIAATWSAEAICLAGRVRDDHVTEDDRLTVRVDTVVHELSLTGPDVERSWLGASWELCVPSADVRSRGVLPFAVSFTDTDPGEPVTVLSSAPERDGVPLGELFLDTPG